MLADGVLVHCLRHRPPPSQDPDRPLHSEARLRAEVLAHRHPTPRPPTPGRPSTLAALRSHPPCGGQARLPRPAWLCFLPRPRPCSASTATSSAASGRLTADVARLHLSSTRSSSASPARTHGGAVAGSRRTPQPSATGCSHRTVRNVLRHGLQLAPRPQPALLAGVRPPACRPDAGGRLLHRGDGLAQRLHVLFFMVIGSSWPGSSRMARSGPATCCSTGTSASPPASTRSSAARRGGRPRPLPIAAGECVR
jgi:hypothetical protein